MIRKKAFTLIELLVVISIIALLLSILMPALSRVKEVARAVVCTSNQGQLGKAWFLYQTENNDYLVDGAPEWLVGNNDIDGYMTFQDSGGGLDIVADGNAGTTVAAFVSVPHSEILVPRNESMEDKIRGLKLGGLWRYLENHKLYNCRSDKRSIAPPMGASATNVLGGYRSYSLGSVYSLFGHGMSLTGEDKHVATKYNQIQRPSSKIVFIEEADGWGQNRHTFNMWIDYGNPVTTPRIWDPLAVWHYGNSTFSYADGHADMYKWHSETIIENGENGGTEFELWDSIEDYEWLRDAFVPR